MIRFELYRWTRSRRLLLVLAVFVFSAVTSVLVAAYLPDILGSLGGGSGVRVIVPAPTWQDLLAAYFKNSSQLAILFSCYLAAWGCSLGTDDRLRLHYRSRVQRAVEVQGPRLAVSAAAVAIAVVCGAAWALYSTAALAEGVAWGRAVAALAVHGAGLLGLSLLAGCLACTRLHPGAATAVVVGAVMLGGAVQSVEAVRDWSPTALLSPSPLLDAAPVTDYVRPLTVMAAILVVSAVAVLRQDVRHGVGGRPGATPAERGSTRRGDHVARPPRTLPAGSEEEAVMTSRHSASEVRA